MESPLYAVGSDGTAQPPSGARPSRGPNKTRPKFPVPTDRMKFDTQIQALRTICKASDNGSKPVDAETMASLMGLSAATAPLNNAFYIDLGLVEKAGKGEYKPSETALQFTNKWAFNKEEAPALLAPAFQSSWFFAPVKQKLELDGEATINQLVETLAMRAGTDDSYSTQYTFLLEWLKFVGLITIDSNTVRLTSTDISIAEPEPDGDTVVEFTTTPVQEAPRNDASRMLPAASPPVVSFSVDVSLTAADLAELSPEQIRTLFEGVGQIQAIKAMLNRS